MGIKNNLFYFKTLYSLATSSEEGIGTAYEYFVKIKKLNKIIKNLRSIAIFGLPEKHGVSLDFLLFAKNKNLKTTVYEDREDTLKKLLKAVEKHIDLGSSLKLIIKKNLLDMEEKERFDCLVNSDCLQRFENNEREIILLKAKKMSNISIFFMPNEDNISFVKTNLNRKTVSSDEILNCCAKNNIKIIESGYIDMPPFPSGISLSKEKREKIKNSIFINIIFFGLICWSLLEVVLPEVIRKRFSHIFYIVI